MRKSKTSVTGEQTIDQAFLALARLALEIARTSAAKAGDHQPGCE